MKILFNRYRKNLNKQMPFSDRGKWFAENIDLNKLKSSECKVLDVCGGYAWFGTYIKKLDCFKFQYFILDNAVECKDFVEKNYKDYNFILGSIENVFPFDDECFDMVWLFGWYVDAWNKDYFNLFNEISRVLKSDGVLYMDWNKDKL